MVNGYQALICGLVWLYNTSCRKTKISTSSRAVLLLSNGANNQSMLNSFEENLKYVFWGYGRVPCQPEICIKLSSFVSAPCNKDLSLVLANLAKRPRKLLAGARTDACTHTQQTITIRKAPRMHTQVKSARGKFDNFLLHQYIP